MPAVKNKAASAVVQTSAPDITGAVATWEAAEAAYSLADRLETEAFRARRDAALAVSATIEDRDEKSNWPKIHRDPRVAPLVEAEEQAKAASRTARDQLVATPAAHWLGFANKFQIVRAETDDLLNPLDLSDRSDCAGREQDFPGSELAAAIHHAALGAHLGVIDPKFLPQIASMIAETRAKLGDKLNDFTSAGFSALYDDACRLARANPPAPSGAQLTTSVASPFASWAAERDRLYSLGASMRDDVPEQAARKEAYDAEATVFENLIRNTPCLDRAAALGKVEWLRLAFEIGETGDEERVLDQLKGFLERLPGDDGDTELLALGSELEKRWAEEDRRTAGDPTDEELDTACGHTGEIAAQIEAAHATTLAGYRVKGRALAWRLSARNEPIDTLEGCAVEAAQFLNDLLGQPRWTPDGELLRLGEQFKRLSREEFLLDGHTLHPFPAAVEARLKVLRGGLQSIREKARQLRATTPEALRVKAIIALDTQPTQETMEFEEEAYALARSLIADVLGGQGDFNDGRRDTFWIAEGFWPQDQDADAEHAALLASLGVTAHANQVTA